ncbi:hypothetical protein H7F15_02905 [Pontibacter sp. Tf4]|uniref:hypothetical protein n=1 Tax=Pontibacter sp. Tf4 TaxID=2761620 RepID=UPI00162A36CA|nr:hypothetical protein [Pontibacter sp. Tf4]MBB6609975.1 hypothetical protein [Pontibacter sp. Tf4]
MQNITLISTVHKEIGNCNADELFKVIAEISPEVIFLEALESTYSAHDQLLFSSFGVHSKKLEIQAIQKYYQEKSFQYVPVLDDGLSDAFDNKYNIVCDRVELQILLDNFNSLAARDGFQFLNSVKAMDLQEEMRSLEKGLLNDNQIQREAEDYIHGYEDSMIHNIYSYCKDNFFDTAIFMCGVAHRKSLINKITDYNTHEGINVNWIYY